MPEWGLVLQSASHFDSVRVTPIGVPRFVWWVLFMAAPLLLLLGGVGIFQLFEWAVNLPDVKPDELLSGLFLAVLPLLLFAFLSSALAVNYVRSRSFVATQNALIGLQKRQNYQQDFIRIIADNRPGATFIIDKESRIWFANAQAAGSIKRVPQEMVGLSFEKIFPEQDLLRLLPLVKQARQTGLTAEAVSKANLPDGSARYIKTQIIPLPVTANMQNAVMVNEDDITNLLVEREARERMFRQVIDTLVAVVDRRDPFAAGHSARVGQVARAIALQMKLSQEQMETAEIAGLLMNFGKVLVPRDILVKAGALTPDELKKVHESLLTSADILALIGFAQPVVPTLRQVLESYDGSGMPNGLQGEGIMITARIVTVSNAFVAMVSARAHRPSLSTVAALEALGTRSGKHFDPKVIEALTAYVAHDQHSLVWLPAA